MDLESNNMNLFNSRSALNVLRELKLNRQILILAVMKGVFMKKLLKGNTGFTLVELMVVVAIIGILSAIAVPNFKKYQAKSKQSEAKIQLAAVYSAEVGTSADWDTYGTCLTIMGYETPPRGYYSVGFVTGFDATLLVPGFTGCNATNPVVQPTLQLGAIAGNKPGTTLSLASTAAQNAFTASAEGSISAAVAQDEWRITETKALTNQTPGY